MKYDQWEEEYADDIFDAWCDSDVESLEEFKRMAWAKRFESEEEQRITDWENQQ